MEGFSDPETGRKLEADLNDESSTRAEKANAQFTHFTGACAKLDERFSAKTSELSSQANELGSLLQQKTQGLSQAIDSLDQKTVSNVQRIDSVLKDLPGEIERKWQDLTARCDKIAQALAETGTKLEDTADADRQNFTERCDELDKASLQRTTDNRATLEELRNQLETTSNAAMSSFKSLHSELQAKLAAHDDAIKTNAQVAAAKGDWPKARYRARTVRSRTHSKSQSEAAGQILEPEPSPSGAAAR